MIKENIDIFVSLSEGCFISKYDEKGKKDMVSNCDISESEKKLTASFEVKDICYMQNHKLTKVAKCYFKNNKESDIIPFELKDNDEVIDVCMLRPNCYNLKGCVMFKEDDLPEGENFKSIESIQFYI